MAEWSRALVSGTSLFRGVGSNPTTIMVILCLNLHDNYNETKYTELLIIIYHKNSVAEWSRALVSSTTLCRGVGSNPISIMDILCLNFHDNCKETKYTELLITIYHKDSVAEWSRALVSGTSLFRGVGSNPTTIMVILCLNLHDNYNESKYTELLIII